MGRLPPNQRESTGRKRQVSTHQRADDTIPRLLTAEEEEKTRKAKPKVTKPIANSWRGREEAQSSNRQRSWSTGSRGKGKGKGKGKGDGRAEQK